MEVVVYYPIKAGRERSRQKIKNFVVKRSFTEEYEPVQRQWPILEEALAYCQEHGLSLVIARIGRLHLNPVLMTILAQSGVEFVCLDNQQVNSNTAQILAASAQEQAVKRSQKTRAVMDRLRTQGVKLGSARIGTWNGPAKNCKLGSQAAAEQREQRADDYYQFMIPRAAQMRRDRYKYQEIADVFNREGLVTQAGKPFNEVSILRLLDRAKKKGHDVRRAVP